MGKGNIYEAGKKGTQEVLDVHRKRFPTPYLPKHQVNKAKPLLPMIIKAMDFPADCAPRATLKNSSRFSDDNPCRFSQNSSSAPVLFPEFFE